MKTFLASTGMILAMATASMASPCNTTSINAADFGYTACEGLTIGNDKAADLNEMKLFNLDEWEFVGKWEDGKSYERGTYGSSDFGFKGGDKGGTFTISDTLWDTYDYLVLVVKAGSLKSTVYPIVAYLLENGTEGGKVGRPIIGDNNKAKDNSHYSLYGMTDTTTTPFEDPNLAVAPIPAAGILLVSAIVGSGLFFRRKV